MTAVERPSGVAVLAALHILLGILFLLGGLVLMTIGIVLPEIFPHVRGFAVRSAVIGMFMLVFALLDFLLAYGLWSGKHWAWLGSMVLAVLGIGFSILSLFLRPGLGEFISLVLDLVIVYYLIQPRVQTYFGRGVSSPVAQSPPM